MLWKESVEKNRKIDGFVSKSRLQTGANLGANSFWLAKFQVRKKSHDFRLLSPLYRP